jgi:hypothetical protein
VVKLLLAVLLFGGLHTVFAGQPPLIATLLATGLLTGATECAGTYVVARTNRWRRARWDSVAAFGLAFGCFEAAVLAVLLLLTVLAAQFPGQLEPPEAQAVREALSDPHRPLTFLVERAIAVPVHLLTSVLILRAAQTGKMSLFWWGFLLKSLIDAVPAGELPVPVLEGIYLAFGLFSLVAFLRYSRFVVLRRQRAQEGLY